MKALIVYMSYHRMNTQKIGTVMSEALGARLVKVSDVKPDEFADYELIGFGSGI